LRRDLDLKGKGKEVKAEEDEELYSDQDDGVEIIDLDNVRTMDWMAPESIRRERKPTKKVKKERGEPETRESACSSDQAPLNLLAAGGVDAANALDLSESEEEEEEPELEDVIEDFATQVNLDSVRLHVIPFTLTPTYSDSHRTTHHYAKNASTSSSSPHLSLPSSPRLNRPKPLPKT
jgi:hypothetical protein